MTEPARKATFERGLEPVLGGLGGAHVRAHGDVHPDEAGCRGEHRADQEADRRPPAELVVEAEQQERDDRDDRDRHVLAAQVGGRALLDGARDLLHALVAGGLLEAARRSARCRRRSRRREQTSAKSTAWSLKKSIKAPPYKTCAETPRRRGFLSQTAVQEGAGSSGRGGVGELEVREHLVEVAQCLARATEPSSTGTSARSASIARLRLLEVAALAAQPVVAERARRSAASGAGDPRPSASRARPGAPRSAAARPQPLTSRPPIGSSLLRRRSRARARRPPAWPRDLALGRVRRGIAR